jgi:hypothetical protein
LVKCPAHDHTLGHAEIEQLRTVLGKHDIPGLQIAMNDTVLVSINEGVSNALGYGEKLA